MQDAFGIAISPPRFDDTPRWLAVSGVGRCLLAGRPDSYAGVSFVISAAPRRSNAPVSPAGDDATESRLRPLSALEPHLLRVSIPASLCLLVSRLSKAQLGLR